MVLETGLSIGAWIMLAVVILAVAAVLIVIIITSSKRKEREPDPLMRSIGITLAIVLVMLLYMVFGGEKGKAFWEDYWWTAIAAGGAVFAFYMVASRKKRAIPFWKLLNKYAWPELERVFGMREYVGISTWPSVIAHTIVELGPEKELRDLVDNILVYGMGRSGLITWALITLNAKTGHNVQMILQPNESVIRRFMDAEAVARFKSWEDEFIGGEVREEKPAEAKVPA